MPTRNYKTPLNELIAKGRAIVKQSPESRYQHRVEAVNLVLGGMPPSKVAEVIKESKNTITSWVKIADEQGFEALKIKTYTGRPSKLTKEDREEIARIIGLDDPKAQGYAVWDGISLSDYILKNYGVKYSVRHCQRILHEMGFSLVRPQPYPNKNDGSDDDARDDFKKNKTGQ